MVAVPAVLAAVEVDPARQRRAIQRRRVLVIGVLHEELVRAQRQDIDEAVAAKLLHAGIHDDGPGQAMRLMRGKMATHEHLPPARQMWRRGKTARIDHARGGNPRSVGQRQASLIERGHGAAGHDRAAGQLSSRAAAKSADPIDR
jgi:hypothetical protein